MVDLDRAVVHVTWLPNMVLFVSRVYWKYGIVRATWLPNMVLFLSRDHQIWYCSCHVTTKYGIVRTTWLPNMVLFASRDCQIWYCSVLTRVNLHLCERKDFTATVYRNLPPWSVYPLKLVKARLLHIVAYCADLPGIWTNSLTVEKQIFW